MDFGFEALKAIDDSVIDRMKKVVDDSVKQISRNVHNILKLLRKIQEACNSSGSARHPSLREVFKPVKLENWLTYFENLSRKITNSFADIVNHLHNLLDEEERSKLANVIPNYEGYSLTEIINNEMPVLKEEIAFLLGFISYPNRQLAGILEQHQRPDGGTHIISKSIATTPAAISQKYTSLETEMPARRSGGYFEIVSRECIDLGKYGQRDLSKGRRGLTSEGHLPRRRQQKRDLPRPHAGRHPEAAAGRRQPNRERAAGAR